MTKEFGLVRGTSTSAASIAVELSMEASGSAHGTFTSAAPVPGECSCSF